VHILIAPIAYPLDNVLELITELARQPDVELTIFSAAGSSASGIGTRELMRDHPHVRVHVAPRLVGKEATGHMASVMYRPGSGHRLAKHILRHRPPDVVHIIGEPGYLSTFQMLNLCRRHWPRVPVTLFAAQNVIARYPFPFPILERRAYQQIRCALPITPAAGRVLRGKGYQGRSHIVPLGVNTELFAPQPAPRPRPFTVGFVGWLERHKGILDLLTAAERIDAHVLLVGKGRLRARIQREAARRPGRIRLHPWVDQRQLPDLLAQMDVLVLPSVPIVQRNVAPWIGIPLREQFGRVLIEAMACGVPVVGSSVGEISHVIGEAGLVYPYGDVGALAQRLAQLRADSRLTAQLSAAGRARAQHFSWSRIAGDLCRVWNGLTAGSMAPRVPMSARATGILRSGDRR
jgi:glycosyltransferase involved in cell wall biosynthesis